MNDLPDAGPALFPPFPPPPPPSESSSWQAALVITTSSFMQFRIIDVIFSMSGLARASYRAPKEYLLTPRLPLFLQGVGHIGVLSISSKHLNLFDLELEENSRKIKLLEIGLEDQRSVDPNLCPKNRKTFLLPYQLVL